MCSLHHVQCAARDVQRCASQGAQSSALVVATQGKLAEAARMSKKHAKCTSLPPLAYAARPNPSTLPMLLNPKPTTLNPKKHATGKYATLLCCSTLNPKVTSRMSKKHAKLPPSLCCSTRNPNPKVTKPSISHMPRAATPLHRPTSVN
eukprot:1627824-Rhodomonas_salina.1